MTNASSADLVTLVNEQGQSTGQMDKIEAHRGEGILHLACSVYLFRKNPQTQEVELLIQQRSPLKIVGGWQWANTICGNVTPGETPKECAHRRLREELNLTAQKPQEITTFLYHAVCNEEFSEREFDHIFAGWYMEDDLTPNPSEAVAVEWLSWDAIVAELDDVKTPESRGWHDFAPWFRLMISDPKIKVALEKFIQ